MNLCNHCSRFSMTKVKMGQEYTIKPCGAGRVYVRAQLIDDGIVMFDRSGLALGYFNINYCPICGRNLKGDQQG